MRVLDEIDLEPVASSFRKNEIKEILAQLFWAWYADNEDHVITTVSILKVWKRKLRVRDLKPAFILLFGER